MYIVRTISHLGTFLFSANVVNNVQKSFQASHQVELDMPKTCSHLVSDTTHPPLFGVHPLLQQPRKHHQKTSSSLNPLTLNPINFLRTDVRVSSTTYLTSIQVTKGSDEEDDDLEEDFSYEKKSEVGSSLFGKFALAARRR